MTVNPPYCTKGRPGRVNRADEGRLRRWVRKNWRLGEKVDPAWHPVVHDEIARLVAAKGGGKVYTGQRDLDGRVAVLVHPPTGRRRQLSHYWQVVRLADGFWWPHHSWEALQLALALLADAIGDDRIAVDNYGHFCEAVVAQLAPERWVLSQREIVKWAKTRREARKMAF